MEEVRPGTGREAGLGHVLERVLAGTTRASVPIRAYINPYTGKSKNTRMLQFFNND